MTCTKFSFLVVLLCITSVITFNHSLHKEVMSFISSQPTKIQFKLWHYAFNKEYDINSQVGLNKYKAFKDNLNYFKEENAKNQEFTVGLGPFSDLSFEEFEKTHLNYPGKDQPEYTITEEEQTRNLSWFDEMADAEDNNTPVIKDENDEDDKNLGESKDWSNTWGYAKDQGGCGSCWAFSVIGCIEAHAIIKGFKNRKYSEQQLVDCDKASHGCKGGFKAHAYLHIKKFGLMSESDYPYEARDANCRYDEKKVSAKLLSNYCSRSLWKCDSQRLLSLLSVGPYSTAILAGKSLMHYTQGEISPENCNTINHAVIVSHINFIKGTVRIRNSWGETWGEKGFGTIKISEHRGLKGCGTLEWAFIPDYMTEITK